MAVGIMAVGFVARQSVSRISGLLSALFAVSVVMHGNVHAQISTNHITGLRDNTPRWHAITGAKIVVAPGKVIERGTIVMRDGRIVAVGTESTTAVPQGARVWKLDGRTVYAGFIDMSSSIGVPQSLRPSAPTLPPWLRPPGMAAPIATPAAPVPRSALASQNRSVRAEIDIAQILDIRADDLRAARELGFTSVLAAPQAGVLRGQSALINTADAPDAKSLVLQARVAQHVANEPNRGFPSPYPNSTMGAIALLRQTLYDARWYANVSRSNNTVNNTERPETNTTLESLGNVIAGKQPVIYQAEDEQEFGRITRIRDEFQLSVIAKGNGYEYRRAAQIKASGMPVIVPVNFPAPPEVENADTAIDVSLETLQHWEQAPSNLKALSDAGVEFTLTTAGLRDNKEFWANLRQAIKRGLTPDAALAALTTRPAKLMNNSQLGTIETGRIANIVVASGDLFSNDTSEIELSFVDGKPYATPAYDRFDARGTWNVTHSGKIVEWKIGGTRTRPTLTLEGQPCDLAVRGRQLQVTLPCGRSTTNGDRTVIVAESVASASSDAVGTLIRGTAQTANLPATAWNGLRAAAFIEPAPPVRPDPNATAPALTAQYPAGGYGITPPAQPKSILIRNATIWTNAKQDKLERADMLVRDGKIVSVTNASNTSTGAVSQVSTAQASPDTVIIDAMGKHVTPGIIDAHSHTAVIGGVNEGSNSITAEVRIGDVIDATDVNIYRQLAGGVTAANVLHGSANTIGGQNQVIKFRWGADAEGLKFANATPGIKFALGENVKQSNWDGVERGAGARFPQTRMGVEQILRDGFLAARHYQKQWADHRANPKTIAAPRRDLQLDTLVEILEKKRIVHIHSYRADEILMFVRFAQEFGFTVGTFQHVLEGYKVADAMAEINAGGSTFSDWWAYKMEVYDAIPANAAIMHRAGVVTTLNSDSNELARRLNTEAAKAVRYGNVPPTEAFKFVTLNAAKQLRIDDRVGSLEPGKDADFVIWNTDPLSSMAIAEQTWIDGRKYFDRETDKALRDAARRERERLLAKALPARMARLQGPPGGAGGTGARPTAADASAVPPTSSDVFDVLGYIALQSWLHQYKQIRTSYWDAGAWHECTEDAK
jgi:imidazolonepropionase-like amidohydrolase